MPTDMERRRRFFPEFADLRDWSGDLVAAGGEARHRCSRLGYPDEGSRTGPGSTTHPGPGKISDS
jgi:hypothetical protein